MLYVYVVYTTVASSTLLHCPSPRLSPSPVTSRMTSRRRHADATMTSSSVLECRVSFVMDDVATVRDLPLYFPDVDSVFRIHPDPVVDGFGGGKKIYKGEALILTVSCPSC